MLRLATIVLLASLFGATPASRTPAVSITALYRERMMLPTGATLHVTLTDANTGRAIASAMLDNPHVPVYLKLAYEPSNIAAEHVYNVAARILVNGEPFFVTDMPTKVITQGHPSQVELLLERVTATSPALLEDRRWTLTELHGHPVTGRRSFLELSAGRASGYGGCNRFSGGYKLHEDSIEFAAAATTMMACIEPGVMETESAFLKALSSVRYWKVEESSLHFFDGGRKLLMRFEAQQ